MRTTFDCPNVYNLAFRTKEQLIKTPNHVVDCMSGQAKANGNLENSSITVSKYMFRDDVESGPFKSIVSLSKGCVAFTSFASWGA